MRFRHVTGYRGRMSIARRSALIAVCAAALAVAGCTSGSPSNPGPGTGFTAGPGTGGSGGRAAGIVWVIERTALNDLYKAGMSESELSGLFNNQQTYIVGGFSATGKPNINGWTSRRTVTTTNLQTADLPSGVSAMLYDNEPWSLTPMVQQHNPQQFEQQAEQLAQSRGLTLIVTPATGLAAVIDPTGKGTADDRFLQLNLIGLAARYANVVDIQAQGLEGSPRFVPFVQQAVQEARAANPHVKVLAGISTNPSGHQISPQTFAQDANAVRSIVDGYWLNIPGAGTACPRCGTPRPAVAVPWLQQLLGQ